MKQIFSFHYTVCLLLLLLSASTASGQDFVWGRSGGGDAPTQGVDDETIKDMATDRNGNVYILSQVMTRGLQVAGIPLTGYGANDIMLASFKPDGSLRWTKVIGSTRPDNAFWLGTDNKDGVYFSASVLKDNSPAYIDKDATSPQNYQHNLLVKYDTAGRYQWHRHPEPESVPNANNWSNTATIAMDVGASGTVYWLMLLAPGTYGNGALTVATSGTYLLKYSASGTFSYSKPAIDIDGTVGNEIVMTVDEANSRFYISGYYHSYHTGFVKMGSDNLSPSAFIGCFKLDGAYMWKKVSSSGFGEFYSRVAIDKSGNIYLAGNGKPLNTSVNRPAFIFNGYTVKHGDGASTPLVIKMDKNGNLLWGKDAVADANTGAFAIALRNDDELVISGYFPGSIQWPDNPSTVFSSPYNYGYDIFAARMSTQNGYVLDMDRIASNFGYSEFPNRLASDKKANVYIGGRFTSLMFVCQGDTLTNAAGGDTDWFLVKYADRFPVSVQKNIAANKVNIYPNPATGQLTIDGVGEGTRIRIFNILGQLMLQNISEAERQTLDISGLIPGSYILQLTRTDGSRESYRVEKR